MGKRQKKPEFPEENRICGLVFICQLIAVLSAVSIVYLSVAAYMPSMNALTSGVLDEPVMCTTVMADDAIENCQWASCNEWCLSKSSGACMQIWVTVRNNGTDVTFDQCTEQVDKMCTTDGARLTQRYNCRKGDQCKQLQGLFNCTAGTCINMNSSISCTITSLEHPIQCIRRENCQSLHGLYMCEKGGCRRIPEPHVCERLCIEMPSRGKNVIVLSGDRVVLARCRSVHETSSQELLWDGLASPDVLFTSCTEVWNSTTSLMARDCINATLVDNTLLGNSINYSKLIHVYNSMNMRRLPSSYNGIRIPKESELVINNKTHLHINLEACVNSLRDECREFYSIYGRDGRDQKAAARFPCFHAPERTDMVVTKFSRKQTILELTLTAAVPGCLFIISCTCLILCTKVVKVGPDAHMHFVCCSKTEDDTRAVPVNEAEVTMLPNDTQKNNSTAEAKISI